MIKLLKLICWAQGPGIQWTGIMTYENRDVNDFDHSHGLIYEYFCKHMTSLFSLDERSSL